MIQIILNMFVIKILNQIFLMVLFFDTSSLEIYQKQQETNVFKGINYIVSFIGIEGTKSLFWGVFKVKSESF